MGLHDGHRQRCKQRFLRTGAEGFDDHQLLELLLFYAIPRCDTNETAHRLLKRFGSLQGVLYAAPEELSAVEGIGESAAVLLRLTGDLSLRARKAALPEKLLNSPGRAGAYFAELLLGQKRELLYEACLDGKGKLLSCRCITKGTVTSSPLQIRQVVENALYSGADSVLLAHNHPSGVALPSADDVQTTQRIAQALHAVDIVLIDHIVVAEGDYISMVQSGYTFEPGLLP